MYDIYIKNFKNISGREVKTEQLVYSIPITSNSDYALVEPIVKCEMGKTGTLEFSVEPDHPLYSRWLQMKTIMRVVYDGTTIFRGRVLTIDDSLWGSKKIHCEGDLAFLMDSQQPSTKEEKRSEITILAYLNQIINNHNKQMLESEDDDKVFVLGEVPGQYSASVSDEQKVHPDATKKYGSNSWETSMSALETLQKDYGGYFRTRYAEEEYVDTIGRYGQGNIDLNNRIVIDNGDGTISTERSFSVRIDNKEVLLPTIVNGVILSEEDAITYYNTNGEYLGKFDTVSEADAYAVRLHERQNWYYTGQGLVHKCYLDWLEAWFNTTENTQPIEISENLINLQSSSEVDNIFTALIPIGSNKSEEVLIDGYKTDVHGANNNRILVPQIVGEFTDAELNSGYHSKSDYQNAINRYGIIYKTEKFDNADTQQKLWEYACDYIKNNYIGGLTGFDLTALDMHHIDGEVMKYLVGDRIPVIYPNFDNRLPNSVTPTVQKVLSATQITYNLHNPDKNTYNLGIPNSILKKKYGTAANKGGGGGGSSKYGNAENKDEELAKALDSDKTELGQLAWAYVINEKYNNPEYQALLAKDPKLQYAPTVLKTSKNIVKEILDPVPGRLQQVADSIIMSGGKLEMNASLQDCAALNPAFVEAGHSINSIVFNAYDSSIELKQKMVSSKILELKDNPLKSTLRLGSDVDSGKVELWKKDHLPEDQNPVLSAMIKGEDGTISNIISKLGLDGSGEQGTIVSNGLTSMLQFFNPVSASTANPTETAEIDGSAGTGKVGKDSGGNWQVKLNETITYVDVNDHSQTASGFVSAKDFNIPEVSSFKTKLAVVDTLVAGKATIGQLEALEARVGTIEADYITTQNLSVGMFGATWLSQSVVTGITFTAAKCSRTESVTVNGQTGKLVTGFSGGSCVPATTTLMYLGSTVTPV